MELTQEQYERIEKYLPKQRGNVKIDNLQFLNAKEENKQSAGRAADLLQKSIQSLRQIEPR